MDQAVEAELYNDIGVAVVEQIGTVETKILIYIERADGGFDYSIRYLESDEKHIRSLRSGNEIALAVHKLSSYVNSLPAQQQWTAVEYWIDYGEINISVSYDELDAEEHHFDRVPAIVERYFPGVPLKRD